jgi:hypothetical protein
MVTWAVDEIEPESVGSVTVDDHQRVRVILLPLAHLLAVGGQYQAVDNLQKMPFFIGYMSKIIGNLG